MTLALTPLLCLAAGSSMGSRSAAGGMGPLLERTCLPMRWTTAAAATCPPCGGLGRRKKPLPYGQPEEQLKPASCMGGA